MIRRYTSSYPPSGSNLGTGSLRSNLRMMDYRIFVYRQRSHDYASIISLKFFLKKRLRLAKSTYFFLVWKLKPSNFAPAASKIDTFLPCIQTRNLKNFAPAARKMNAFPLVYRLKIRTCSHQRHANTMHFPLYNCSPAAGFSAFLMLKTLIVEPPTCHHIFYHE